MGIAAHSEEPSEELLVKARRFIDELWVNCGSGTRLVVGGYWGLMKHVVDTALNYGFTVIILPPLELEHISYPEKAIVIKTGVSFRARSVFLVRTSDLLVVLGGGAGCIQELVTAYTEKKPIYVLVDTGYSTDIVKSWPLYLDSRALVPIVKISDPVELAREVCRCERVSSVKKGVEY
ncbi:MAG: hypothetical protein LM556_02965 [Desulfurococcaceae archaeon]|jgi:uncharacterized protein (TIGR00725 family)|nr:hypothetical protein [Desulfurococcaceae archaeon]